MFVLIIDGKAFGLFESEEQAEKYAAIYTFNTGRNQKADILPLTIVTREVTTEVSECQNCGQCWKESELKEIEDYYVRILPGETVPSGECPECGALCHLITQREVRQ